MHLALPRSDAVHQDGAQQSHSSGQVSAAPPAPSIPGGCLGRDPPPTNSTRSTTLLQPPFYSGWPLFSNMSFPLWLHAVLSSLTLRKIAMKRWRFITVQIPFRIPHCSLRAHPHINLCSSNLTLQHSSLQVAFCLHYKATPNEEINYYEFIWQDKTMCFCAPQSCFWEFWQLDSLFWDDQSKYLPPHGLFLPWKSMVSCLFPYATLALKSARPPALSDEERADVGTWCSWKMNNALQ